MSVKVKTSGCLISSLLFEHWNSPGDQEGFLIGEIQNQVTSTISDSQMQNVKEESFTSIHSFLPCNNLGRFYDVAGKVDPAEVAALTRNEHKNVIGWYKFRRNSTLRPSLRERCIHAHLSSMFPGVQSKQFVFALFSASLTTNQSTHSFDHTFLQLDRRGFTGIPVEVMNLGDSVHQPYKLSASNNSGAFADTVAQFKSRFQNEAGQINEVAAIHDMNETLHSKLSELSACVLESEGKLSALYEEVENLRAQLKRERRPLPKAPEETDEDLIDMELEIPSPVPPRKRSDNPPPSYSASTRKPLPPEPINARDISNVVYTSDNVNNSNMAEPSVSTIVNNINSFIGDNEVISSKESVIETNLTLAAAGETDPFDFVTALMKNPEESNMNRGKNGLKHKHSNQLNTTAAHVSNEASLFSERTVRSQRQTEQSTMVNSNLPRKVNYSNLGSATHDENVKDSLTVEDGAITKNTATEVKITLKPGFHHDAARHEKSPAPLAGEEELSEDDELSRLPRSTSPTF